MLSPSDKELDRLSREAAEQYEPDEQISSWEQLVPRLDREIGIRPHTRFRYFGKGPIAYAVAILAVTGISFFFLKQKQAEDQQGSNKEVVSANSAVHNADASGTRPEESKKLTTKGEKQYPTITQPDLNQEDANHAAAGKSSSEAGSNAGQTAIQSALPSESAHEKSLNGKSESISAPRNPDQRASDSYAGRNKAVSATNPLLLAPAAAVADHAATNQPVKTGGQKIAPATNAGGQTKTGQGPDSWSSEELKMATLNGIVQVGNRSTGVNDAFLRKHAGAQVSLSTAALEQSRNTQKALRMNRSLKIGLMYGSDVTSVNAVAPERLSNSFGLTIGYQVWNHWSLNTGLIYTKKNYSADAKDFHPTYSSLPAWANLEYVTGDCNMWEFPLTIRYDFDRIGNTTFFINGGASSYLMTHESYVFFTHYYNSGVPVVRQSPSIPYDTRDAYLFAVIDFSLGVEQQLGKAFSLQVEPIVKIPVQGVGYGNVELNSFGVNFVLKYSPVLKASRK